MKQSTFEKILRFWEASEQQQVEKITATKSEACLSFEQFEAGQLASEQQKHIKDCLYCRRLNRLVEKYKETTTVAPSSFKSADPAPDYNLARLSQMIDRTLREILKFLTNPLYAKSRQIAIAGALVAIVILGMLTIFKPFKTLEKGYAKFAQIEPLEYQSLEILDGKSGSESVRFFEEGMLLYQQQQYQAAINKLLLVVRGNPNDANANFYMGLCTLLLKDSDNAISFFQKVIELKAEFLLEKCYWYLGNAYLLKEDGKKAVEMFEKVVAMKGDYEWEARKIIIQIGK